MYPDVKNIPTIKTNFIYQNNNEINMLKRLSRKRITAIFSRLSNTIFIF